MAIIAILAAIAIPFYVSYQTRNDFHIAVETTAQSLRRAQALARAGEGDATWGVHVETGSITLFEGVDYADRNTDADERVTIPQNILLSGDSDLLFLKLTGMPLSAGAMTFTSGLRDTATVSLNSVGMIDY